MVAWIIYFKQEAIKNQRYIQFYMEEGTKLGMQVKLIHVEDLDFGVEQGNLFVRYQGQNISKPTFVIFRAIYPLLNKHLELMEMKVYNNSMVSEICNDKAKTYQYLASLGIPMVNTSFYRNDRILNAMEYHKRPAVIKAVDGHGGNQVFLLDSDRNPTEVTNILQGIGKSDIVVQPRIGNRNQDLRVYVIGTEIIACVLRTAKDGFKSNFSLGGEVHLYNLKEEEINVVNKIIGKFDFGLVGIDFIIGDEGELIFNEIEDVVGARMLYQCCPDINIVKLYLNYIAKHII